MVTAFSRPAFQLAAALVKDRAVAEEIVQEAFVRAMSNARTPRELPQFRRWFYRIVVNLTREHHRRGARSRRLAVVPQPVPDPQEEAERRMGDLQMAAALVVLSEREREAVYLRFFQDLAFDDVAGAMGINESTARVLVHRGLERLRDRLNPTTQKRETS